MADSSVRKRTHDATMSGKNPYVKLTDEQLNNELEKLTGMSVDGAAVSLPDDLSEAGGREPPAKMAKTNLDADLALDDHSALHVHITPVNESNYANFKKINPYQIMEEIQNYVGEYKNSRTLKAGTILVELLDKTNCSP